MHRRLLVLVVGVTLLAPSGAVVLGDGPSVESGPHPDLVALYPNPAATDDAGEFVTVRVPPGVNISAYDLADDNANATLDTSSVRHTASQTRNLTFSTTPNRTRRLTDGVVKPLSDSLQLANSGETVQLLLNGSVIDSVTYDQASEASVYETASATWRPLGATTQSVVSDQGGTVQAFVLPDAPERATDFLENATDRILLAGYTISSPAVVDTLVRAHERGVTVEVLAEARPVGGMDGRGAAALDRLARSGVNVSVLGGDLARYRYHHAKYAVVDDRALVTTENWKKAGTGGAASRGWGVVTGQQHIVAGLVDTFRDDSTWVDAVDWEAFDDPTITQSDNPDGNYPTEFEPREFSVEETRLFRAPDTAGPVLQRAISNAQDSIAIKQMAIGDEGFPLLRATVRAAERGVEVRILLSGAWYAEEENRELKTYLETQAEREDLPLSVRIATPDGAFEKIHAKAMLIDGETTVLGSLNWNNNSLRNNREVGLIIESDDVASYYGDVFDSDWQRDDGQTVPIGYIVACLLVALLALAVANRLEFTE
jgi:phosphatidylserine/phosphatidylglycerophosphate/cardiolipin synthase-like enzyme